MRSEDIDDLFVKELVQEVQKDIEDEEEQYIKEKEELLMSKDDYWEKEVEKEPLVEEKEEKVPVAEPPKVMPAFYQREK